MSEKDNGGFTTGLLIGGIIGTVIGILIAPKSGSETRAELLEQSEYLKGRVEELSETVRDKVTPTIETAREQISPLIEQVNARFTTGEDSDADQEEKTPN